MIHQRLSTIVLLASAILFATSARGGDLAPPGGFPSPSFKTLDQVGPSIPLTQQFTPGDATATFVIIFPGAYHLVGNLQGEIGKSGIRIETSNVSIDLRGFTLEGVGGSNHGIESAGTPRTSILIRDGFVRDWGGDGVHLDHDPTTNQVQYLEQLFVNACGGAGIACASSADLSRCHARANGGEGFRVGGFAVIRDCSAIDNGGNGFTVDLRSIAERCLAVGNDLNGIVIGDESTVHSCVVRNSEFDGIVAGQGTSVIDCLSNNNFSDGIVTGFGALVSGSLTLSNSADGIRGETGGVRIDRCSSIGSVFADGIEIEDSSSVTNCYSRNHNVGSGIFVTGFRNRVDSNNVITTQWGIRVDGAFTYVTRNRVEDANVANFLLQPNNILGTVRGTPVGAAPWDNFDF